MRGPEETRAERYLRFSHGSMIASLVLVLALGGLCIAMAFRSDGGSWWMAQAGWVLVVAISVGLVVLQKTTLRGERWNPAAPEARAILQDEWRRTNMDRAMRAALVVVLVAQLPLGLLLARLPSLHAVMAMAASTATLGLATLIALFLFFSREKRDGR